MNAITPILPIDAEIDARLAFLARAAARFDLVQSGAMNLDEAYSGLVVSLQCFCTREIVARMERHCRRQRHFKKVFSK
jgi:hypothetical protein